MSLLSPMLENLEQHLQQTPLQITTQLLPGTALAQQQQCDQQLLPLPPPLFPPPPLTCDANLAEGASDCRQQRTHQQQEMSLPLSPPPLPLSDEQRVIVSVVESITESVVSAQEWHQHAMGVEYKGTEGASVEETNADCANTSAGQMEDAREKKVGGGGLRSQQEGNGEEQEEPQLGKEEGSEATECLVNTLPAENGDDGDGSRTNRAMGAARIKIEMKEENADKVVEKEDSGGGDMAGHGCARVEGVRVTHEKIFTAMITTEACREIKREGVLGVADTKEPFFLAKEPSLLAKEPSLTESENEVMDDDFLAQVCRDIIHVHTLVRVCVRVHIHILIYTCTRTTHSYPHAHTHIRTHTHTHTHKTISIAYV